MIGADTIRAAGASGGRFARSRRSCCPTCRSVAARSTAEQTRQTSFGDDHDADTEERDREHRGQARWQAPPEHDPPVLGALAARPSRTRLRPRAAVGARDAAEDRDRHDAEREDHHPQRSEVVAGWPARLIRRQHRTSVSARTSGGIARKMSKIPSRTVSVLPPLVAGERVRACRR